MATGGDRPGSGPERAFAPDLPEAGPVTLDADESGHLVRSRRARAGDPVVLFDGAGTTRFGRLTTADARAAVVEVEGPYADREPGRPIRIATAMPEAGRADALVSSLAELGVATLKPLTFARSPSGRDALPARRADRWARIVREAAKVNGRARFLEIAAPGAFETWVASGAAPVVLLDPDPAAPRLVDALAGAGGDALPWLVVGPEGGFTDAERDAARRRDAGVARLGATALRVQTAAVAAAAVAAAFA
ncbi:MAG: RsmE family RNA methyltransferase [Planctomycetota bacterium]|nr:RsmE family RNA methyltransferase [Planctomycetota bacterium]